MDPRSYPSTWRWRVMFVGWLFATTFSLVLALDFWTKAWVQTRFQLFDTWPLLPGLAFTYVRNKGAAFSLLANTPEAIRRPFFLTVAVAASIAIVYFLRQTPRRDSITRLALGLVAGGAIGNAIDRARFGEVVDFIEVGVRGIYTWPVFNVADSAVFIGVCLLLWRAYKPFQNESNL